MSIQIPFNQLQQELKRSQLSIEEFARDCLITELELNSFYDLEQLKETLQMLCSYIEPVEGFKAIFSSPGYTAQIEIWGNAEIVEMQEVDLRDTMLTLYHSSEIDTSVVIQAIQSCERYAS